MSVELLFPTLDIYLFIVNGKGKEDRGFLTFETICLSTKKT